jgi:hypothetical protein
VTQYWRILMFVGAFTTTTVRAQEHSAVDITPVMGEGGTLSIKVSNLSKLTVAIDGGALNLRGPSGPCDISFQTQLSVPPARETTVQVIGARDLDACVRRAHGATARLAHPFMQSERQMALSRASAGGRQRADIRFNLKIGEKTHTVSRAEWRLFLEP